jgi:hypothetical protein
LIDYWFVFASRVNSFKEQLGPILFNFEKPMPLCHTKYPAKIGGTTVSLRAIGQTEAASLPVSSDLFPKISDIHLRRRVVVGVGYSARARDVVDELAR